MGYEDEIEDKDSDYYLAKYNEDYQEEEDGFEDY